MSACKCADAVVDGYCKDCAGSHGYTQCIDCEEWGVDTHSYRDNDYCWDCFDNLDIKLCSGCDEWFDIKDMAVEDYCENCAGSNGYTLCVDCEEWVDEAETHWYNDCEYCHDCFDGLDINLCSGCDEYHASDSVHDCDGTFYCTECAHTKGWFECYDCEIYSSCTYSGNNEEYCEACFFNTFFICEGCDDTYDIDDRVVCDDGCYCANCSPNMVDEGDLEPSFSYMKENKCDKVCSDRHYGLELESADCKGYMGLGLDGWGAKYDASVTGKEFYSAIFRGDRGLRSIRRLCDFAKDNDWTVDYNCGYHLHLNMRHEELDSLKAIAMAYYHTREVWQGMAPGRVTNSYCNHLNDHHKMAEHVDTEQEWSNYVLGSCRCNWVNWVAYNHHKSLEIRLHAGTFDADKICNWIRAHITFTDWASNTGFDGVMDTVGSEGRDYKELLAGIWERAGCADLAEVYGFAAVTV